MVTLGGYPRDLHGSYELVVLWSCLPRWASDGLANVGVKSMIGVGNHHSAEGEIFHWQALAIWEGLVSVQRTAFQTFFGLSALIFIYRG